jgi:hypothetical protein
MRPVRPERTNWRDEALSARHRLYGFDLPMTDIDFLVCEYSSGKAKAIIEYKREDAPIDFKQANAEMHPKSYDALKDLADRASIPFFVIQYKIDFTEWHIIPMNSFAELHLKSTVKVKEWEYIVLLNMIRDYKIIDGTILEKFNGPTNCFLIPK